MILFIMLIQIHVYTHIYVCVCDSVCVTCMVHSPRFCPLFFWTKLIIFNDNDNIIHNDLHVNSCTHTYVCVCVCVSVCITCMVDSPRFCLSFFGIEVLILSNSNNTIHNNTHADLHVQTFKFVCVSVCMCVYVYMQS